MRKVYSLICIPRSNGYFPIASSILAVKQSLAQVLIPLDIGSKPTVERLRELWAVARAAYDSSAFTSYRRNVGKLGLTAGTYGKIPHVEAAALFENLQAFMVAFDRADLEAQQLRIREHSHLYLACAEAETRLEVMALQMEAVDAAYRT